jgi:maltose O-acetyltransferase
MTVTIREYKAGDQAFMEDMLYQAIYVHEGPAPDRDIIKNPKLYKYIDGWEEGDLCLIAEVDGIPAGAFWSKRFSREKPGYGFTHEDVPEMSIALSADHRGQGIGTQLMEAMIKETAESAPGISLSVDRRNPAVALYRRLGFEAIKEDGHSLTMLLKFNKGVPIKSERQKMLDAEFYNALDPDLVEGRRHARRMIRQVNETEDEEERSQMLKAWFGSTGDNVHVEPGFKCDYGINIHVGDLFYANYDCVILDVCQVRIGANCFMAPGVHIYAATHPLNAAARNAWVEYGKPVTIGDSVWIGGRAVINPGVTIGDNVVIGAGSVVVKDIPSNVVVAGNPAKIIRHLDPIK